MRRPWWPFLVGPLVALGAVGGAWLSARRAELRIRDATDAALARSAAAYLAVVTPSGGTDGYDAARLVANAHALATASFWPGGLQITLGTVPLLPDSIGLVPVPDSVVAALDQGADHVVATHSRFRATLVPFLDRDRWDLLGWAAAWRTTGSRLPVDRARLLAALAAAGVLAAALAFLMERDRRWRVVAFVVALGFQALFAANLGRRLRQTARAATETRLLTVKHLVEVAATAQGVRQSRLPEIAVGLRVRPVRGPVSPSDDVARWKGDAGPVATVLAATPRTQAGLSLSLRPLEADLSGIDLGLGGWVALAGLALGFTAWAARARLDPRRFRGTLAAWGFLAPAMGHLVVFSFVPALFTFYLAFHRWDLLSPARPFVGLANFGQAFGDGRFLHSLGVTAVYTLNVPATLLLALGAAVMLDRSGMSVRVLRTILFVPFISSVVAVALVWQWMYQPDAGLINQLLRMAGITGPDWLGNPRTALFSLIVMSVWVQVGYQMVVLLGGLQAIPPSYHDAARVDGAGPLQRFRWITLPLLRPTVLFVLVTGIVSSFQVFTYVAVMTDGGPLRATDVAVFRIYQEAWEFLRFGTASAMSVVLLVLLLAVTWLQFRWLGRRVEFSG